MTADGPAGGPVGIDLWSNPRVVSHMTRSELAAMAERWRTRRNPDGTPAYDDGRTVTVGWYSPRAAADAMQLADAFVAGVPLPIPSIDGKETCESD